MNTSDTGQRGKDTLPDLPQSGAPPHATPSTNSSIAPTADDLGRLHQFCWIVVREPRHATMTFRLAHCVMETICRWQPSNGAFLNGLALAQFRIGEYQSALDTLAKSEEFIPGTPISLAFQAMAHHHIGDHERSLALFWRLQQVMQMPPWHLDTEAVRFLHEAQNLIFARVKSEN
jgi:hypothetical protein